MIRGILTRHPDRAASMMSFLARWCERPRLLGTAFGVVVAAILVAGLFTRDYAFRNEVDWREGGAGLVFGAHGIAFTEPAIPAAPFAARRELTIELALQRPPSTDVEFGFLAVFHDGNSRTQLLIGQWHEWIVVMNGDDYDHRRREPRATVEMDAPVGDEILLTIVSDVDGTALYLDGEGRVHRTALTLAMPGGGKGTRLVLGNSPSGSQPWSGAILGLALYDDAHSAETVKSQFEAWRRSGKLDVVVDSDPVVHYPFDEGDGRSAADRAAAGLDLHFPLRTSAVERAILGWRPAWSEMRPSLLGDMVLNLVGFLPFGFLLAVLLARRMPGRRVAIATTLAGLLLSLGIEVTQAWIPSRTSSFLDLILNTAGAAAGAAVALLWNARSSRRRRPE